MAEKLEHVGLLLLVLLELLVPWRTLIMVK